MSNALLVIFKGRSAIRTRKRQQLPTTPNPHQRVRQQNALVVRFLLQGQQMGSIPDRVCKANATSAPMRDARMLDQEARARTATRRLVRR